MKASILTLLFFTVFFAASAQVRQSIYVEGFGKNIMGPALMYERTYSSERRLNLEYGAGIGYIYRSLLDDPKDILATIPLHIGANLGRGHNKFEFGLAGFIPLRSYIGREESGGDFEEPKDYVFPFTLYLGFKHYPKDGNGLFFHANLQPLLIPSWIPAIPWAGVGIGYSFQKK